MNDNCHNCGHNCCCDCQVARLVPGERCFYCSEARDTPTRHGTRCVDGGTERYRHKYICFSCRRAWKPKNYMFLEKPWSEELQGHQTCPFCKDDKIIRTPRTTRPPPQKDIKSWKVLERVHDITPFKYYPKGSKGRFWYDNKGIGCTVHYPKCIKEQIWVPTHPRDYERWKEDFKNKLVWPKK